MARNSKYNQQSQSQSSSAKTWQTALYVRLSREDGDRPESESIISQKAYLQDYLRTHKDLTEYKVYADDGWSGTNFDRPQFICMIDDIKAGKVNCVLVKDLSRFGRNYIESGRYLETFFPLMNVRFISINDHIDSYEDPNSVSNVMVPMKNVMNDEYCRDISSKVRSSLDIRRSQGKFIGSFATYGYKKDPNDHHRLIIDEEAAAVVRNIYSWFLEGKSIIGIAKHLNSLGIPNPSAYKRLQGMRYHHPANDKLDGLWPDSSVRRILRNEMYTGVMVQGRNKIISYKVQVARAVPEEDWIRVENTHNAIIPRETFDLVQQLLQRDTRTAPGKQNLDLFSGFLRCADCGRAMNKKLISQPYKDYCYYICSTFKKMNSGACTKHTIRSDKLGEAVLTVIQKQIELAVEMDDLLESISQIKQKNRVEEQLEQALNIQAAEQAHIEKTLLELYPDFKAGLLSQETYLTLKKQYEQQLAKTQETICSLHEQLAACSSAENIANDFIATLLQHRNVTELSRELLVELVDRILIHEGGGIDIHFKFADSYKLAAEYINENKHLLAASTA